MDEHAADEITVHDAPLVPVVSWVRASGWLTEPRMFERIYTTTAPVAVVAATALRTMREAARMPDEDEPTDTGCVFTLQEYVRGACSRGQKTWSW